MEPVSSSAFSKTIKEIRKILHSHSASLLRIENILNTYTDMYEINKEMDTRLATRIKNIEIKLNIKTTPELTIRGI